jgi:hypothetical protein
MKNILSHWSSKWERTFPFLIYFSWDIYRDPTPKKNQISKLIFDTLLWVWGAEPTHSPLHANSRVWNINFDIWICFCGGWSLCIFHEKYIKDGKVLAHLGFQSKVSVGSLIQSVKGSDYIIHWSRKWARTLPSLTYFSWDIHRDPPPQNKFQISLIFDFFLEWGLYKYPMKNILRTEKFFPTWGFNEWYSPSL